MPEGQVLEFSGITKRFGAVTAVSDFSARVEPGRVTGFLGPNGAGKTTTLRILLGLVRPTAGTALIGGAPYSSLREPLQSVGAVLEASSFHPGRTAANHLRVYAQAAGLPAVRVDEALGVVGLADVGGRNVGGFSLGMRQRLGLAYALLGDPGVLVLDEPSNGLDPEGIKWMRGFLRNLAQEGRTVLVSSHLLAEVQQTVDSVLIIAQGRLVYQGALEDLADPSEFATVVDAPERTALAAALEAAGASFELLRSGLTVRGLDPVAVGQIAASAGVALSSLQRRGPALEEVFLDLVSGARVHPTAAGALGAVTALTPIADADAETEPALSPSRVDPAETATAGSAPEPREQTDAAETGVVVHATDDAVTGQDADAPQISATATGQPTHAPQPAGVTPPATYAVAGTGVIDIVPFDAGDAATDAYRDGLALDADPDVEALGAIDAELSRPADAPATGAVGFDTDAAVASGAFSSEAPDIERPLGDADLVEESGDVERPWENYVKTEADVEADAFFSSFAAEQRAERAASRAPGTMAEEQTGDAASQPAMPDEGTAEEDRTDEGGEPR
ncbi:ATP-binding cassette domain-containing protein [Microbacterium sp. zg.B48]|uniref:ATP-binding cassette domain-containing protein n=1 Tax=Microbacterium sp. zg.B48 TaxID=2969408 RepID=UPI00214C1A21|nr:ATP-binding cassette domain-containing protein [Microbacterium sp. zg.B48]MCR2762998.1 ATP-binding cassette domain-containing protein [Microbacterium sp. zg.B48]